ncbi:hypothetical protein ACMFMG_001721 [Clarireedia jacksonii]
MSVAVRANFPHTVKTSSHTAPEAVTGRDLLADRLPDLLTTGNSTTSISIHRDLEFRGVLVHWSDFEEEVVKCYEKHFPSDDPNAHILEFKPKQSSSVRHPEDLNHLYNEVLFVGEEHSVQGRFFQQAAAPVTVALQDKDYDMRYGDSKASTCQQANSKLPDFVASKVYTEHDSSTGKTSREVKPRVVGEAKVWWTHPIYAWMNARRGQIALYLKTNNLKYGFVTTYNETMFLKVEKKDIKGEEKYVLYYSNVIGHTTIYNSNRFAYDNPLDVNGRPLRWNPYQNCVSTRQCLYYMTYLSHDGKGSSSAWSSDDNKQTWVLKNPPKSSKSEATNIDERGYNSGGGQSSSSGAPTGSTNAPPGSTSAANDGDGRKKERSTSRHANDRHPAENLTHRPRTDASDDKRSSRSKTDKPEKTEKRQVYKSSSGDYKFKADGKLVPGGIKTNSEGKHYYKKGEERIYVAIVKK